MSRLPPSIPYLGHTGCGIARYRYLYPSCESTDTSVHLLGHSFEATKSLTTLGKRILWLL